VAGGSSSVHASNAPTTRAVVAVLSTRSYEKLLRSLASRAWREFPSATTRNSGRFRLAQQVRLIPELASSPSPRTNPDRYDDSQDGPGPHRRSEAPDRANDARAGARHASAERACCLPRRQRAKRVEPRPPAARDTSAARKSRGKSRRVDRSQSESCHLLRAR